MYRFRSGQQGGSGDLRVTTKDYLMTVRSIAAGIAVRFLMFTELPDQIVLALSPLGTVQPLCPRPSRPQCGQDVNQSAQVELPP